MLHRPCEGRESASGGRGEPRASQDRILCALWDDDVEVAAARCGARGACWLLRWPHGREKRRRRPRYLVGRLDGAAFAARRDLVPGDERGKAISTCPFLAAEGSDASVEGFLLRTSREAEAMPAVPRVTVDDRFRALCRVRPP